MWRSWLMWAVVGSCIICGQSVLWWGDHSAVAATGWESLAIYEVEHWVVSQLRGRAGAQQRGKGDDKSQVAVTGNSVATSCLELFLSCPDQCMDGNRIITVLVVEKLQRVLDFLDVFILYVCHVWIRWELKLSLKDVGFVYDQAPSLPNNAEYGCKPNSQAPTQPK